MIVVDENIHDRRIIQRIAGWYRGTVVSIVELRPQTVIRDDAVPLLLLQASLPTFVTLNVDDFWHKIHPHRRYCVVTIALPQQQALETPDLLRRLLRLPRFRAKNARMGLVFRVTPDAFEYYAADRQIVQHAWTNLK